MGSLLFSATDALPSPSATPSIMGIVNSIRRFLPFLPYQNSRDKKTLRRKKQANRRSRNMLKVHLRSGLKKNGFSFFQNRSKYYLKTIRSSLILRATSNFPGCSFSRVNDLCRPLP